MKYSFVIIAFTALIAVIVIVFGYNSYPVAGANSIYFLPTALNVAAHRGLFNEVAENITSVSDLSGKERFIYYPPLYPYILGFFITKTHPQNAFLAANILNAITLILSSVVLIKIATIKGRELRWLDVVLICGSLLMMMRSSGGFEARPEIAVRLIYTVALLQLFFTPQKFYGAGFGLLLGILAVTHLIGAIAFFILVGMLYTVVFEPKKFFIHMASSIAFASVVIFLIMSLISFGFLQTLNGIIRHWSSYASNVSGVLHVAFLNTPSIILYGTMLLLATALLAITYRRYGEEIKSKIPFMVFSVLGILFLFYFLTVNVRSYYITPMSVFVLSFFLYYLSYINKSRMVACCVSLIVILLSLISIKDVALFYYFKKYGMSLETAREEFNTYIKDRDANLEIEVSNSLWVLSENYKKMHIFSDLANSNTNRIIAWQQFGTGDIEPPPAIKNCPLKKNFFNKNKPFLFGYQIEKNVPGYNFAIYDCGDNKT